MATKTSASTKINGLRLMELSLNLIGDRPVFAGFYALAAISEDGSQYRTHGKCTIAPNHPWSDRTEKLLEKLVASMEEDLLPQHFNHTKEDSDERPGLGGEQETSQI